MRIGSALIDGRATVVVDNGHGVYASDGTVLATDVIADWATWRPRLEALGDSGGPDLDPDTLDWLPPVIPDKLICVGSNYTDHVAEMEALTGWTAPASPWPFAFYKPVRAALIGHRQTVQLPSYADKIDWEGELAIVIGDGSKASGEDPLQAVFGYSVINDLSVRDFVPPPHWLGQDAVVVKGFEDSAPMGPWIALAEDVVDPQNLQIRLSVNGVVKQDSSTSKMIDGVRSLVAHFGQVQKLLPGDVIATGSPAGTGVTCRPPEYLHGGDVVRLEIDGVCELETWFSAAATGPRLTLNRAVAAA